MSVSRESADSHFEATGELLDLSRRGVRLRLQEHLPVGESVRLSICPAGTDVSIEADAAVSWVQPEQTAGWSIGFALQHDIDQASIDALAKSGTLERRADIRQPISFVAEAKAELGTEFHEVEIIDISDGGFCLLAEVLEVTPGDRLLIKMNQADVGTRLVRARVAWINTSDRGQTIGCVFLTKTDQTRMRMIAVYDAKSTLAELCDTVGGTRWSMVAGMVAILVFVQFVLSQWLPAP